MRRIAFALVALIALLLIAGGRGAYCESAKDLNTEGYRLYQKGSFPEALDRFRRAVAADPDYTLGRYNLACTLGVLRKKGPEAICKYDAYKSAILDQLEAAIRLDPETRKKAEADPDLDPIRDTVRYARLFGYSPTNPEDVGTILAAVSWYGAATGAFGPAAAIDFKDGGTLTLSVLNTSGEKPSRAEYTGTYFVSGTRITFIIDRPIDGVKRFEGALLPGGTLDIPGLPGPFSDDPHDCEA